MHYRVRARFREETAGEFQRVLRDGTIAVQRPDGQEIVDGHRGRPLSASIPTGLRHDSQAGSGAIIASELRLIRSPSGFLMRKPLASIRWPACADGSG